jgi:purine nucleoside phosphorylase
VGRPLAEGQRSPVGLLGSQAGTDRLKARAEGQVKVEPLRTPYGSVDVVLGSMGGAPFAGVAKAIASPAPPHRMPHRATFWALKKVGCARVLSTSVVTSFDERLRLGDLFVPDDFLDLTGWSLTYFEGGPEGVHNAEMEAPFCRGLSREFVSAARSFGLRVLSEGTVAMVPGPQHPTVAEAARMAQAGAVAGSFSAGAEAKLARELGLCLVAAGVTARGAVKDVAWRKAGEARGGGEPSQADLLRAFAEGREPPAREGGKDGPASPRKGSESPRGGAAQREAASLKAKLKDVDARLEEAAAAFVPQAAAMAPCRSCRRGAGPVSL